MQTTAIHAIHNRDLRDKFIEGASRSLAIRAGLLDRDSGNEYAGMALVDLARVSLKLNGLYQGSQTANGIAGQVLAAHTSSDFPNLLSNVAGKVLRQAYGNFPSTWQQIAAAGSVSDFKVHPRIQMGSFNKLDTIPEGGEYSYGSMSESYETAQAITKGKALGLSRQMIVNDDLGGFARRAQLMGRAAARTINTDLYAFITSGANNRGPTGTDGGQFFNATAATAGGSGHANLVASGGGAAPSVATISAGRAAMRKQMDMSVRDRLNILPKVIVTPVDLEEVTWAVINSTTDFTSENPNKKNYSAEVARLDLVTDPYLDEISATAWYLFADPNDAAAAFEIVFLNGDQEPYVDEMIDFDTDSMKFKVRLDYGIAIGDWRGGYRNEGA